MDERAVKDRTVNLLINFGGKDLKNRAKSGTEEHYGQLEVLLAEIDGFLKMSGEEDKAKKRARKEKEDELRHLGKAVRWQAR